MAASGVAIAALCLGAASWHLPRERTFLFHYENVLGTSLELKVGAASEGDAERAEEAALSEIERERRILSGWDATSEFSRWQRTRGQAVPVSPELFEILGLFDQWRERTGGALDASAEAVTRVWKEAEARHALPAEQELAAAVAAVGQSHWHLDAVNHTATHLSATPLALNSFTKSYIAGRAANAALAEPGVDQVVVNIGGDLVVRGGRVERVDIADPKSDAENAPPITSLEIRDRAVATSGNYRRGEEIAGRHYSHIVDPRTGMPCDEILSSTVVAPDPADAGAMATAFSVLTPLESRRVAAAIPGAEYLLITRTGERIVSPGWSALVAAARPAPAPSPGPAPAPPDPAWDGMELTISFDLAPLDMRARRPYLVAWVEDGDKFPLRTIALWYNKDRYLPELRAWYRSDRLRSLAEGTNLAHSVSSATRSAGHYTLQWDGKDNQGKLVKAGKYTVYLECAREHGGYDLFHREIDFNGTPNKIQFPGGSEIASASLDYHKIAR
jgi:thiamine biosynthesis lipoprotein ApbE